jgi:PhnB protein
MRPTRKENEMSQSVKPVPEGFHTATPYLVVRGAAKAIDFYTQAFGAKELYRMPGPDGKISHAEIQIGDSILMLGDENLEWGAQSPETLGGSACHVLLYVESADAVVERAVAAGAQVTMPLQDMFWGDRYGKLKDPFGHEWSVATHIEDVPPEEMEQRAAAAMAPAS